MGLRESLQSVTQFLQTAATKGHQLRENEERAESRASSTGAQNGQPAEQRQDAMPVEDRQSASANQQDRERQV